MVLECAVIRPCIVGESGSNKTGLQWITHALTPSTASAIDRLLSDFTGTQRRSKTKGTSKVASTTYGTPLTGNRRSPGTSLITSPWIKTKQGSYHTTHHNSLSKTRFKTLMAHQIPGQLDPILQPDNLVLLNPTPSTPGSEKKHHPAQYILLQ
jgi:hypothetical protein